MLAVGLTGGIGAGKSRVADLMVERGAVLVDADRVAREVVEPGAPAYQPLVDRFGVGILDVTGHIDRPALAALVFDDSDALADLNAITHPVIGMVMVSRGDECRLTDDIVVFDVPLLTPAHRGLLTLHVVVVVDCPLEIASQRLIQERGMTSVEVASRIAVQPGREERCAGADLVIDNSTTTEHLISEVDRVWACLTSWPVP